MNLPPAVIAARLAATADHATPGRCTACGANILTARVGRVAALDVVADPEPITPATEAAVRATGRRLTWHLVTTGLGTRRITWRDTTQIRAGPATWPVLADHECPPRPVQERLL